MAILHVDGENDRQAMAADLAIAAEIIRAVGAGDQSKAFALLTQFRMGLFAILALCTLIDKHADVPAVLEHLELLEIDLGFLGDCNLEIRKDT